MADTTKLPIVELALRTDPGRDPDKQVNEDRGVYVDTALGVLVVVCDGMGGHAGGKEAAELAVATIVEVVQAATLKTPPRDALRVAIEEANHRVWSMPTSEGGFRPGSTVVAVLAHAAGAEVAHVGDSRVYVLHAGAIAQITKDHSMVQEMVDRHLIKAEDAPKHPDANKIMRALGIAKDVQVELRPEPFAYASGDVFVLCSDGLSDLVHPGEILEVAGSRPALQAAGQLIDLANARGGHDNITALIMRMKGAASTGDGVTLVRTVAQTALDARPVPPPPGSGPSGTILSAPMAASPVAGAGRPASFESEVTRHSSVPERSKLPVLFGIVIAAVALAVAGALIYLEQRPRHHNVRLVADDASTKAVVVEDSASPVTPDVTLAPVLAPPSGVKVPWWKDADAAAPSGENRDCVIARWQREHGRPVASYEPLAAKCRAAGGQP